MRHDNVKVKTKFFILALVFTAEQIIRTRKRIGRVYSLSNLNRIHVGKKKNLT